MGDAETGVRRDGVVLRLTLDRPGRRNSLTPEMVETLVTALTAAASDDTLRAIHLRGAGEHFCAGVDLVSGNTGDAKPRTGSVLRRVPHTAHRVIELLHTVQLPVVATVRGWAAGMGCNLALAADFTVAAPGATFWEPFLDRGFSPDSGATWLLPRLTGLARARRMLLLGERVDGTTAAEWGLIHEVADDPDAAAEALLARLAAAPTVAFGLAKQALAQNLHATLPQAMNNELFALELACRTRDFKEGLAAFRDRRAPEFEGR
ncbi:enoyl-CoA hydratase/isomerase family protein [Nocardia asteroides]|uniref:enoyl-CoA hydratase/isomerase family protein n=1 Tax=Nocardia asteroides TaxID=1824 RepID=UPI001E31E3C5|nr:enoyl-CoA hydratase-related protein [Nocardia asteroides]UGT62530.1 enoyl-CoA hydratase-related protein [Nocardia asteroides]